MSVVIGVGVLSPLGTRAAEIFERMARGEQACRPVVGFSTQGCVHAEAGEIQDFRAVEYLGKKGLRQLDRIGQLSASAAALALADCALDETFRAEHEVALVLGTNFSGAGTVASFDQRGLELGPAYVSPLDFANTVFNAPAGQVAIRHNLRGTNSTVTGGSNAGLKALAYAHDLLHSGQEELVLAGGAEELTEVGFAAYDRSPYPGELFLAEGAAFAVLVPETRARAGSNGGRILGHDSALLVDPEDPIAPADAIAELLRRCDLATKDIDLICLSAAGYAPLDAMEQAAVARVFPASPPQFAPKHWLGETQGASGPLQLLLSLEALRRGVLPQPSGPVAPLAKTTGIALLLGFTADGLLDMLVVEG